MKTSTKKVNLILALILVTFVFNAQTVEWINGYSVSKSNGVATDASGNIYTAGEFQSTTVFGSTTLTAQGFWPDAYLTKTDVSGNLTWAVKFGGKNMETVRSIAVVGSGIYVTGQFNDTIVAGTTTIIASGFWNHYLAKFDQLGNCLWAKRTNASDISICGDGTGSNILATGTFSGTVSFGTQTLTSTGGSDIFLAVVDPTGSINSFMKFGGTSNDVGYCIKSDNTGNIYLGGYFSGTTFLGSVALTAVGNNDAFVAKLNPALSVVWAKQFGGAGADGIASISVNASNNVYIGGGYNSVPVTVGSNTFTTGNSFVCQLDNSGLVLWANYFGGTSTGNHADINSIAADAAGNVYSFGNYQGMSTFGSTTVSAAFLNSATQDMFLSKLDAAGNFAWVKGFGSTSFTDYGNSLCYDNNKLYATGTAGPMTVDNFTLASSSGFLAKFSTTPVGIKENYKNIEVRVYPNPVKDKLVIESEAFDQSTTLTMTDLLGKEILKQNSINSKTETVDVSMLLPGIYFLRINADNKSSVLKILKE